MGEVARGRNGIAKLFGRGRRRIGRNLPLRHAEAAALLPLCLHSGQRSRRRTNFNLAIHQIKLRISIHKNDTLSFFWTTDIRDTTKSRLSALVV